MDKEKEKARPVKTRAYTAGLSPEGSLTQFQTVVSVAVGAAMFFAVPWLAHFGGLLCG